MYNTHKFYIFFNFCITFLLVLSINFFRDFLNIQIQIEKSTVQSIITFLSIIFGFYMTSLSVLYRSNYSKDLFKQIDSSLKNQRKIHTLIAYFKNASYCLLLSILIFLLVKIIKYNESILLENIWMQSLVLSLLSINILFIFLLFKVFIKGFIIESSKGLSQ